MLWRHGKEWLPTYQVRLNDKCERRDSDGKLLGQLGTPTAGGRRCRYSVTRGNGKYGTFPDSQEQPIGEILYTDAERSTVCERANLTDVSSNMSREATHCACARARASPGELTAAFDRKRKAHKLQPRLSKTWPAARSSSRLSATRSERKLPKQPRPSLIPTSSKSSLEVKTVKSRYTRRQQDKDHALNVEGGVPVGENARKAGLDGKVRIPTRLDRHD